MLPTLFKDIIKVGSMIFQKSLGMLGLLCALAVLGSAANQAGAAAPKKSAATESNAHSLSLQGGKLRFVLTGFERRPMPRDDTSTVYVNRTKKQAITVTESPMPSADSDMSDIVSQLAVNSLKQKQYAMSPNYRITSEKTSQVNGLSLYQLSGTGDINGMALLMTTLMALGNQKMTIVEVMSQADDPVGHAAAVKNILSQ